MTHHTRGGMEYRFGSIVADLLPNASYYRRMAKIAIERGEIILWRELTVREVTTRCEAYMAALDSDLVIDPEHQ